MVMTTANVLTVARILLVPLFVVELLTYLTGGPEVHRWLAIGVFGLAAGGDAIDGYIARRFNQRTEMGSVLDPLADKLLLVLGLVALSLDIGPRLERIPLWLTGTVLCRDVILLLLVVLIYFLVGKGRVQPHLTGKAATVLQMVCIFWTLLKGDEDWLIVWAAAAAACTIISGVIYIGYGIRLLRGKAREP